MITDSDISLQDNHREYIIRKGYVEIESKNFMVCYGRNDGSGYSVVLFKEGVYLFSGSEYLATSSQILKGYRYSRIPVEVLLDIIGGESSEIGKRLYEYDLNRNLEVLG
jgi:hypothetical protein